MKIIKTIAVFILFFYQTVAGQDGINEYLATAEENNPALKAQFYKYMEPCSDRN